LSANIRKLAKDHKGYGSAASSITIIAYVVYFYTPTLNKICICICICICIISVVISLRTIFVLICISRQFSSQALRKVFWKFKIWHGTEIQIKIINCNPKNKQKVRSPMCVSQFRFFVKLFCLRHQPNQSANLGWVRFSPQYDEGTESAEVATNAAKQKISRHLFYIDNNQSECLFFQMPAN
jgi:hypothetical protein